MPNFYQDPIKTLASCGGVYICPKDAHGNRLGPLCGLAGTYDTPEGKLQFVSDEYFNFAKGEQYPSILQYWAAQLKCKIPTALGSTLTVCVGMPRAVCQEIE